MNRGGAGQQEGGKKLLGVETVFSWNVNDFLEHFLN